MATEQLKFFTGVEDFRQAESLAIHFKRTWRYDHTSERWHHWDGVRWAEDKQDAIINAVADYAAARLKPNAEVPPTDEPERKALLKLLTISAIRMALVALASFPEYATDGSDWDQDPMLLGCTNGIVNLATGILDPKPPPETLVTRSTGHAFKPLARTGDLIADMRARAPLFTEFLVDITSLDGEPGQEGFEDVRMAHFLLTWFGASLFGFTPEQRFLLMTGIGRNGKGALKHSVIEALGEYAAQPDANVYSRSKIGPARSDGARADLMALKGRRVAFFSEPDRGQFNEEMLKAHTGGDLITARALYSNNVVSWEPTHSITFLVNDVPSIEDVGPSMAARVMVADFRRRYDGGQEDKNLYGKLKKEADGILAILVWFAGQWYESWNTGAGGLIIPQRVTAASQQFVERNDPIATALDAAFDVGAAFACAGQVAYVAYQQWHVRSGVEGEPMSGVRFSAALEKRGFKKKRTEAGILWSGFRPLDAVAVASRDHVDD